VNGTLPGSDEDLELVGHPNGDAVQDDTYEGHVVIHETDLGYLVATSSAVGAT